MVYSSRWSGELRIRVVVDDSVKIGREIFFKQRLNLEKLPPALFTTASVASSFTNGIYTSRPCFNMRPTMEYSMRLPKTALCWNLML